VSCSRSFVSDVCLVTSSKALLTSLKFRLMIYRLMMMMTLMYDNNDNVMTMADDDDNNDIRHELGR
jgi:hypothetical protein